MRVVRARRRQPAVGTGRRRRRRGLAAGIGVIAAVPLLARLRDGAALARADACVDGLHSAVVDALQDLAGDGVDVDAVAVRLAGSAGVIAHAGWLHALARLHAARALEYRPAEGDVTLVPHAAAWRPGAAIDDDAPVALSRFARLRAGDRGLVAESPLALATVELGPGALAVVERLATPSSRRRADRGVVRALAAAGLLASDAERAMEHWTVEDALVHVRSRVGRSAEPPRRRDHIGTSARPATRGPAIAIDAPGDDGGDVTLHDALATRRSRRRYAERAITRSALGALLARAFGETVQARDGRAVARRAYASGGALHCLDAYAAVARCDGLAAGLYAFDARARTLHAVAPAEVAVPLVRAARAAAGCDDDGQALLVLAADFGPVVARYDGIAYALLLAEVGAALHTAHLVADAAGLAACPIGSGDSEAFCRALGTGYFAYTSIGELLVGSRHPLDA